MARKLEEQVVVITGASSGIGRTAARMFVERGARVVACGRNEEALASLEREVQTARGELVAVRADVSEREQVEMLARAAVERYQRIDTWVNNAGVSMYATFEKLTDSEMRRIMDVNFMGTVYGMQTALPIMREQGAGTIINIASIAGKRAIPLQSVYSASKYAIVGLSEAVRTELASEGLDINICAICPPSINTPFFENARTKEGRAPKPLPPVYEPEDVADAILMCAERPQREVLIGGAGKAFAFLNVFAPSLSDWYLGKTGIEGQLLNAPKSEDATDNLFDAPLETRERADWNWTGGKKGDLMSNVPSLRSGYTVAASVAGLVGAFMVARYLLKSE